MSDAMSSMSRCSRRCMCEECRGKSFKRMNDASRNFAEREKRDKDALMKENAVLRAQLSEIQCGNDSEGATKPDVQAQEVSE